MEKKTTTSKDKYIYAKGGRKTATAQVRLYPNGTGKITVNGKPYDEYFTIEELQEAVVNPLKMTGRDKSMDVTVKVVSGGIRGQAEATRHGISRALVSIDPELKPMLKAEGFMKRDPRVKERKKPGLRRARRAPQWSKR